ncbi:MAG: methionyl-tRNA formyltransferase [Chloroflexota bacterium]
MRVVFMGTPEFALPTLKGLHDGGYRLVGVFTRPDKPAGRGRQPTPSPVKELALRLGLPVYQPATLRRPAAVELLRSLEPEVVVVAAYGLILPREVLAVPPHGCLNVHPSLLPRWRGPSPIPFAILAGDEFTGVTVMLMDEGMDTGPILARSEPVPIGPEDTTATLTPKLAEVGARLLLGTLPKWVAGQIIPEPQDDSQATYSRLLKKEDGVIDWGRSAEEIWRQVRAFDPWPGAFTWWEGKLLKILACQPLPGSSLAPPGTVVGLDGGAAVQTGSGLLKLERVQLEGRRAVGIGEFLRGYPRFIGSRLPS